METSVSDKKASQLELARLKNASEAYKVHKSNYIDPVTEEQLPGFQAWPEFRDEFLADWKSNRRVVTEKEADVIFDNLADESLTELATIGATVDINLVVDGVEKEEDDTIGVIVEGEGGVPIAVAIEGNTVIATANPKVIRKEIAKRRSTSKKVATAKVVRKVVAKKKVVSKPKKVAAKKKSGATSADKAKAIIERYVARKWARKDVIEKLVNSIDGLGVAYAATLYQKFA